MDLTPLFKASLKTVSLRNKALSNLSNTKIEPKTKLQKQKNSLDANVKTIVIQISKLHQLLVENQEAYLNFSNYLPNKEYMSDVQRDEIDSNAQSIIGTCSRLIKELKIEIVAADSSPQVQEHRESMLVIVEDYLKKVCKVYSEQKVIRLKRVSLEQRMAKLEPVRTKVDSQVVSSTNSRLNYASRSNDENYLSNSKSPMKIQEINEDIGFMEDEDNDLSPEDIQMFEAENEQLYNDLNAFAEEAKEIESKVVCISEMQEIFTEKILDQDRGVDRLMTTTIGSTENVKKGNEQIREAIQRGAGFRVYFLFLVSILSFTLLFLEWYE